MSTEERILKEKSSQNLMSFGTIQRICARIFSVGLPFYAVSMLGGERVAIIISVTLASELMSTNPKAKELSSFNDWKGWTSSRKWTLVVLLVQLLSDCLGLTSDSTPLQATLGYLALTSSVLFLPLPYPTTATKTSIINSPVPKGTFRQRTATSSWDVNPAVQASRVSAARSPMISTPRDTDLTIASGVLATVISFIVFIMSPQESQTLTLPLLISGSLVTVFSAVGLLFADPKGLSQRKNIALPLSLIFSVTAQQLLNSHSTLNLLFQTVFAGSSCMALHLDTRPVHSHSHNHPRSTDVVKSHSAHSHDSYSRFTRALLSASSNWPLLHSILIEKDSRRILYFMWWVEIRNPVDSQANPFHKPQLWFHARSDILCHCNRLFGSFK